jgi:hypothetical protein
MTEALPEPVAGLLEAANANDVVVTAEVGGNGFNGPSHLGFLLDRDRVSRMTITE